MSTVCLLRAARRGIIPTGIIISGGRAEGGDAPNNWVSIFGGSAWEYDRGNGDVLPASLSQRASRNLNWENPALRQEIYDMMAWWCEKGDRMASEWMSSA